MATPFNVKGQQGSIPSLGLGTATLFKDACKTAVTAAIKAGYRHIDTALLYDNQEAVGAGIAEAIAAGYATRADLFVTTKVGFYPAAADGKNCDVHLSFHPENKKGFAETAAAVDLCLAKLGLAYVDLVLVHNPCTNLLDYQASVSGYSRARVAVGTPLIHTRRPAQRRRAPTTLSCQRRASRPRSGSSS